MGTVTLESIAIVLGREDGGRWWADIESMLGVMAYGDTRDSAIAALRALALRVAADCIDHVGTFRNPSPKFSPWHESMEIGQGEATLGCLVAHRVGDCLAERLSSAPETAWLA